MNTFFFYELIPFGCRLKLQQLNCLATYRCRLSGYTESLPHLVGAVGAHLFTRRDRRAGFRRRTLLSRSKYFVRRTTPAHKRRVGVGYREHRLSPHPLTHPHPLPSAWQLVVRTWCSITKASCADFGVTSKTFFFTTIQSVRRLSRSVGRKDGRASKQKSNEPIQKLYMRW